MTVTLAALTVNVPIDVQGVGWIKDMGCVAYPVCYLFAGQDHFVPEHKMRYGHLSPSLAFALVA